MEKGVRIVRGEDNHGHSHGHSHSSASKKAKKSDPEEEEDTTATTELSQGSSGGETSERRRKQTSKLSSTKQKTNKSQRNESKVVEAHEGSHTSIQVAAWLNLLADFMHNFTDGLAIGASFIAGSTIGFGN